MQSMMKLLLASSLGLVACGGKQPAPAPVVSNTEPAKATEPAPDGRGTRVIQRRQDGGVIELHGDRGAAMKIADDEMKAHCGPGAYTIVQEGEEAVAVDGGPRTGVAWRVHYQCNN